MDNNYLAELLFPDVKDSVEQMLEKYPPRNLKEGARVSRMAPSPTGFVHLGNLVQGITSERLCHQSGGVLFLRIEDTDSKREVEGAVDILINSLKTFDINFDEGASSEGDIGIYGPYVQSMRKDIYHVFAKKLVSEGKAYPCFCTEEELSEMHKLQEAEKANFGYFGKWAVWRDRSIEDIKQKLDEGAGWVLRFRSEGSIEHKIKFTDLIKGAMELTENDMDIVLLKSDGIPTYHFAHVVDDTLMHTTHVVRGDEWLPSLPVHLQLFSALGLKAPKYLHIGPLMKMDGSSKRKLSKRKDPELALTYYEQEGFPAESVYEYVLTILNSNFEDWRAQNKDAAADSFKFSYKKMNPAGSLFDYAKLRDVSKNVISAMSKEKVYDDVVTWAEKHDARLRDILVKDKEYALNIFAIGRGGKKPRKDIAVWREVKEYIKPFYNELFEIEDEYPQDFDKAVIKDVLCEYEKSFNFSDDQTVWFDKIKAVAEKFGFASDMKAFKANPEAFKGSVADISMFIRVAVTGKVNSPDMYTVMQLLGEDTVINRLNDMINKL